MTDSRRGVPKGTVNNPKGRNQYTSDKGQGTKDSRILLVLSDEQKHILKEAAEKNGMSLSSWIVEVALQAASS